MIQIALADEQLSFDCAGARLCAAARMVLERAGIRTAVISLAVVNDPTIRALHRAYLGRDEATDVLSFPLEQSAGRLEGEVVVSAETAARVAPRYGWRAADELLLYVIHGTLHLVGYDDRAAADVAAMRAAERDVLAQFGLVARPPRTGRARGASSTKPVNRRARSGKGARSP
ncbi:MAG: rRNA maturation RNase YbeY [Planctomycetes bacterium RBG_16_64_10]|nr:MAG: rRNA maturation RNase YbeY [Planctomycetes bacterium RBG_16_64_10]